jgi:putative nucleotidyltransferase with HDIG domain
MTQRTLEMPTAIRDLLQPLAGGDAYLVGGFVRDLLLGRDLTDIDLAVAGDAPAFARSLADALGGSFVLLDQERGIARVALDDAPMRYIDVAALRGPDIGADLAGRDFTIDAIAAPLASVLESSQVELIDPHGGVEDIERCVVRLVSEQALIDDPLRLLRAVRLAVQLDFKIEPETSDALRRNADRIDQPAAERQRDELARCFETPRGAVALRLLDDLGLLERLFPEVTTARGVTQPKEHHYDVFDHLIETVAALDFMLSTEPPPGQHEAQLQRSLWSTLAAWDAAAAAELRTYLDEQVSEGRSRRVLLKFAGLLHDVAKPETRAPDETGRIRFFGHAELGAETSRRVLRQLRFSRREIDLIATMVEEHLRPTQLGQPGELPSRRALFRFYRDTGDAAESVLLLSLADALAARGPGMTIDAWRGYVAYIGHILSRRHADPTIVRPIRLLTGDELIDELRVEPGREIGRLLASLEEAQASGEVTTREQALAFVRRLHGGSFRSEELVGAGRRS